MSTEHDRKPEPAGARPQPTRGGPSAAQDPRIRVIRNEALAGHTRLFLAAGTDHGVQVGMTVRTRAGETLAIAEVNVACAPSISRTDSPDPTSSARTVTRRASSLHTTAAASPRSRSSSAISLTGADQIRELPRTGDTYIAALGRSYDVPPAIAKLVTDAERAGRRVWKTPIVEQGFFVGYRLHVAQALGPALKFDIIGAASRFAEESKLPERQSKVVRVSNDHDAPPEGGNFGGGYTSSARQAARYRAYRRAKEAKE